MFTWICPKCGADVPPAYDECPRCSPPKARSTTPPPAETPRPVVDTATATAPAPAAVTPAQPAYQPPPVAAAPAQPVYQPPPPVAAAPAQPVYQPPPVAAAPAQPVYQPPPAAAAPAQPVYQPPTAPVQTAPGFGSYPQPAPARPKKQFPAWLAAVATAGGMLLVLAVLYLWVIPSRHNGQKAAAAEAPASLENAGQPKPADSPYAKDLEVAGFRISEDKTQRVQIRFLVINHSGAELPHLKGQISLKAGAANSIIDFPFSLPSMGPYESREITSSTKTTLRAYELPDWQFIKPDFWVTEAQR